MDCPARSRDPEDLTPARVPAVGFPDVGARDDGYRARHPEPRSNAPHVPQHRRAVETATRARTQQQRIPVPTARPCQPRPKRARIPVPTAREPPTHARHLPQHPVSVALPDPALARSKPPHAPEHNDSEYRFRQRERTGHAGNDSEYRFRQRERSTPRHRTRSSRAHQADGCRSPRHPFTHSPGDRERLALLVSGRRLQADPRAVVELRHGGRTGVGERRAHARGDHVEQVL